MRNLYRLEDVNKLLEILTIKSRQWMAPEMEDFDRCWCSVLVTSNRGCYIITFASSPAYKGGVFVLQLSFTKRVLHFGLFSHQRVNLCASNLQFQQ